MKNLVKKCKKRAQEFLRSDTGRRTGTWARRILNTGIFIWLLFELTRIGWFEIWQSFPTQAWFYILFIFSFFQLPLFEVWIYRITWVFNSLKSIPVFLVKKIYNKDVLGYSGEVYFYMWARQHLNIDDREIFMIIKDNNIISSVASTFMALGVLAILVFTGQIVIVQWMIDQSQVYFYAGLLLTIILIFLFVHFRHHVISMNIRSAYKIFTIQIFRLFILKVFYILMYMIVLPEVPLHVWFTFLAIEIVLTRIPFLPNRDLIFLGLSVTLAEGMMVAPSDIAGIVVVKVALSRIFNVGAFGLAALVKKSNFVDGIEEPPATSADILPAEDDPIGKER